MEYGEAAGFTDGHNGDNTDFWIGVNEKGVIPLHIAFAAKNKEEVEAFYKAALDAGAKDNGGPGYRTDYWSGYYAAFVHDADGHNIEVVWYDYSKVEGKK
jgi:predicted lactoylglutathione lyase